MFGNHSVGETGYQNRLSIFHRYIYFYRKVPEKCRKCRIIRQAEPARTRGFEAERKQPLSAHDCARPVRGLIAACQSIASLRSLIYCRRAGVGRDPQAQLEALAPDPPTRLVPPSTLNNGIGSITLVVIINGCSAAV
jgi:hypothetical protein